MALKIRAWIVAGFGALSLAVTPALANDIRTIDPSADPAMAPSARPASSAAPDADLNSDLVASGAQPAVNAEIGRASCRERV